MGFSDPPHSQGTESVMPTEGKNCLQSSGFAVVATGSIEASATLVDRDTFSAVLPFFTMMFSTESGSSLLDTSVGAPTAIEEFSLWATEAGASGSCSGTLTVWGRRAR